MSRVVIWTIVAIVVVLGVIFIVTAQRQKATMQVVKPLSDEAYERYTHRMENQVESFGKRIERMKARHNLQDPQVAAIFTELESELREYREAVENLKGKTTTEDREEAFTETQEHVKKIRRLIRDLGGTTEG
ncbi:MAG: DUF1750 domain-containing protein [Candidatus Latescibacteria bacterium]|nr:DUF1750 domain-containing protein [Candidatus Latescibacterota bacterium]